MRDFRILGIALAATLAFTACSKKEEPEAHGVVALIDGKVTALSDEEAASACKKNFCEPNYVYYANFGSRNPAPAPDPAPAPSPPPPAPSPTPTPTPTPPVTPAPPVADTPPPGEGNEGEAISERLDYSRVVMNMSQAWQLSKGSRDIIVAVVDTGVQLDHRDLVNNIWRNEAEAKGRAGVDDDGNGYVDDVYGYDFVNDRPNGIDDNNHGTHCAGIIGAEQNGIGIIGVSQRVKIMPLKFLSATGSGSTDAAIKAIDYALRNGAHVISNSWGGGGRSTLLDQAIQRAVAAGVVVTAAAGNEASNNDSSPSYPAGYDNVIAVASTDSADALSSFSNYGSSTVEIAAPGSAILSTVRKGGWSTMSGTSMATPQVSGAIALAMSVAPNKSIDTYRRAMCDSSKKILLSKVACGRLDVAAFLNRVRSL